MIYGCSMAKQHIHLYCINEVPLAIYINCMLIVDLIGYNII